MTFNIVLFLIGVVIAALTLRDVFETVIVTGVSTASLQVTRRLSGALLPLWKLARGKRRGLSGTFAPLVLVLSFIIWMALLMIGFGLMAYAFKNRFDPPLESYFEALYIVGSALVTVGLSEENPLGITRWIVLGGGFCGFAVVTMAVAYLLQVQNSISARDTGIVKLNTSAGEPPSALTLLERFAALHSHDEVRAALIESRNWCATVRQSHSAHPTLIYFETTGASAGWPAALGAVLDLGLLAERCIADERLFGPAVLLREEALRMARDLAQLASLKPKAVEVSEAELKQAVSRIASSGYPIRKRPDYGAMSTCRAEYCAWVEALAEHLGKPTTTLVRQD